MKSLKSLLITTSNDKLDDTANKMGVCLEDLAAPYFIMKDGGEYITIASPRGGQIPVDPESESTGNTIRFRQDSEAMYHFFHALPINEIRAVDFDLIFIAGGYGAMWDFQDNKRLKQVLEDSIRQNMGIGLVGHAVVALVSLTTANGEPFVKGKRITAFSNSEEALTGRKEKLPFLLESGLISLGALYSKGADFCSYVVADGNIVTGQNPASSSETAKQLLSFARNQKEAGMLELKLF